MNTEVTLTAGDLMTVVGASAAAGIIVQFLKMLFSLSARWVRILSLLVGVGVVVGAGLSSPPPEGINFIWLLLLVLVGMSAGMATYATFDTARSGFDYAVERRLDPELGVAVTAVDPEDA